MGLSSLESASNFLLLLLLLLPTTLLLFFTLKAFSLNTMVMQ
jgi:hypothetical protein